MSVSCTASRQSSRLPLPGSISESVVRVKVGVICPSRRARRAALARFEAFGRAGPTRSRCPEVHSDRLGSPGSRLGFRVGHPTPTRLSEASVPLTFLKRLSGSFLRVRYPSRPHLSCALLITKRHFLRLDPKWRRQQSAAR